MCKLAGIFGIKRGMSEEAWNLAMALSEPMIKTDSHGFGYAAISNGKLSSEKWLYVKDAWEKRVSYNQKVLAKISKFEGALHYPVSYNAFGQNDFKNTTSIMLHARISTNLQCIENTHPFIDNNIALIHNGVINNAKTFSELCTSSCDSEAILRLYIKYNVAEDPTNWLLVAKELEGYYATMIMNAEQNYIDIIKDNTAKLSCVYVKALDCFVYATDVGHIFEALKECKLPINDDTYVISIAENTFIRIDATTGEPSSVFPFEKKWNSIDWGNRNTTSITRTNSDDGPTGRHGY